MKKLLPLIFLFAALSASAVAQAPQTVRQESFDKVWRTVKEKHFDPTFGGVDWDKVR